MRMDGGIGMNILMYPSRQHPLHCAAASGSMEVFNIVLKYTTKNGGLSRPFAKRSPFHSYGQFPLPNHFFISNSIPFQTTFRGTLSSTNSIARPFTTLPSTARPMSFRASARLTSKYAPGVYMCVLHERVCDKVKEDRVGCALE